MNLHQAAKVNTDQMSIVDSHAESICGTIQAETETSFPLHEPMQMTEAKRQVELRALGQLFEHCLQRVSQLEAEREELIQGLLSLQEPMLQEVGHFRWRLVEAQRQLARAQSDYEAVHEEVQKVKRKLFATARECVQSQVELASHEQQVSQFGATQEELQSSVQRLSQELAQMQGDHQTRLRLLREQAWRPHRLRATSDVSQCRQASARLQRRLSGCVTALEAWYEPHLGALLRRRRAGEEALTEQREQAAELRARLGPLMEHVWGLEVQRSCLERRISFMEMKKEESTAQLKETVDKLQETRKELQLEFEIQLNYEADLKDLVKMLREELVFLRGKDETCDVYAEHPTST